MRVALLGCGGIAPRHVGAVKANGLDLVGCCGRDQAKTDAFATEHGGEAFVDLDRMIDVTAPDLLIATHANILPRTFSADAPQVVVTSTSGSLRPMATAASNPLRFIAKSPEPKA